MFRILIVNATGEKWKTQQQRIEVLARYWNMAKNAPKVIFEWEDRKLGRPMVDENGRIDKVWYDRNVSGDAKKRGFLAVMCIFSVSQGKKYGLKQGLRGHHMRDTDFIGETWVVADETTRYKYPSGLDVLRFDKTAPHELSHMIAYNLGVQDRTHEYEEKYESVAMCFKEYDWNRWNWLWQTYTETKARLKNIITGKPTSLHPVVKMRADKVVRDMSLLGHNVTIFQGFRSFEEQDALYAQGRTKPGAIVTNAKGGESKHNYGLAVDIVFVVDGKPSWNAKHPWRALGAIGNSHGFVWGGSWTSFTDLPHLEYGNYSIADLKAGRVDYSKIK